jgi:hypothetical protein
MLYKLLLVINMFTFLSVGRVAQSV